jgi:hypothetical protein
MICGSHIVAFTFRVIQTAIRGSSNIGQHNMLAARMTLPLSQVTFIERLATDTPVIMNKTWFFSVSSRKTPRYEVQLGQDHSN